MTKDEAVEANRRIRIVLRKQGFQLVCASPSEIWEGEVDEVPFLARIENGLVSLYAHADYNSDFIETRKIKEDLAGVEI